MAATSYQHLMEDLNVQGDPITWEFEDYVESKIEKEIEKQALNDSQGTGQPPNFLGPMETTCNRKRPGRKT